jgi:hypothetical protein
MKANHSETLDVKKIYQNQWLSSVLWGYITGVRVHAPDTNVKDAIKSFHEMINGSDIGVSIEALTKNYERRCNEFMNRNK